METNENRTRWEGIVKSVVAPISDDAVKDARGRRDNAKATAKADCAPTKSKDIDQCNRSKVAVGQAEAELSKANATHGDDVRRADQQHRQDVADAQDKLDHLSIISADLDMVAAGVEAIVPGVPEAWVTRGVVVLWVLLFSIGPCAFLRLGLVTIEEGCR